MNKITSSLLFLVYILFYTFAVNATDYSGLEQQLADYSASQKTVQNNNDLFDSKQKWGVQYKYYFPACAATASSDWFNSGNTRIAVYNSSGKNVGSIDLANIISGGKIDALAYTGLNGNLACTGEIALTYGNDFQLSYMRLYGNATAHNQILTHPDNGAINSYVASTLNNSLDVDIISLQKDWQVAKWDMFGLRLLVGAKEIMADYSYQLTTAAPSEVVRPNYSGAVNSGIICPVPYVGAGITFNLGDFYLGASISGLPGIPAFIRERYLGNIDVSMLQFGLDCNYQIADWLTAQAGYNYLGFNLQLPANKIQNYIGSSFILPDTFNSAQVAVKMSGPYLGINIHY